LSITRFKIPSSAQYHALILGRQSAGRSIDKPLVVEALKSGVTPAVDESSDFFLGNTLDCDAGEDVEGAVVVTNEGVVISLWK
jgi:hypothetical protein